MILFGCIVCSSPVFATTLGSVPVTSFTQISADQFVNINPLGFGNPVPAPITIGSLTISSGTIDPGAQFGDFLAPSLANTNDPGDGAGRAFATQNYRVNFDLPLAAFGATFYHVAVDNGMESPAVINVYDGLDGAGNLIGSVTSSGGLRVEDFVAVWSNSQNIRSAVMAGTSQYKGMLVDAYGFSFTPVPEPSPVILAALAASGLWSWRVLRRRTTRATGDLLQPPAPGESNLGNDWGE